MRPGIPVTAYELAQRFVGLKETAGAASNPAVLAMLPLHNPSPARHAPARHLVAGRR